MRAVLLIVFCLLSVSIHVHASSESSRIEGVAEFLIDRANDNYLYIFEKKIRDNEDFACYFPETRANLDVGGLKELLYSRGLWEDSIRQDLEVLATRAMASSIEKKLLLSDRAVQLSSVLIEATGDVRVEYQGQRYPLNVIPVNASQELRSLVNGFSDPLGDLVVAMNVFRQYRDKEICDMPREDFGQLKQKVDALIHLEQTLERFSDHLQLHADKLVIGDAGFRSLCAEMNVGEQCAGSPDIEARIAALIDEKIREVLGDSYRQVYVQAVAAMEDVIETYRDSASTTTAKVAAALKLLRKTNSISDGRFENMSRYIMFFAQVSDSDSPEEVKGFLEAYTLPAVSFYSKREHGAHWMITSYLGISGGETKPDVAGMENENKSGLYAPIGFEWSYGTAEHGSWSVMLSPFDFAYPVSLKLNAVEEDAEFEDVVAPSVSVAYGLREYPLTIGIAYQRGRRIDASDDVEERTMLFVAFDMPLFGLN